MKILSKKTVVLFMIVFLLVSISYFVSAEEQINIKLATIAPSGHPLAIGNNRFAELVEKRTEGRIIIETYHDGVLGGEAEITAAVGTGSIEMANVVISSNFDEKLSLHLYQTPTMEHLYQRLYSEPYQEVLLEAANANNIKVLSMNWSQGYRHMIANRPLTELDHFEGLTLRNPSLAPLRNNYYEALGANPTALEWGETYDGLQRGVIDAMEAPIYWLYSIRAHEVVEHLSLTGHILYNNGLIVNKDFWENSLSEVDRNIILSTAYEAGEWQNNYMNEREDEVLNIMKSEGAKVHTVEEEFINQLVELMETVREEWADNKGFAEWYARERDVINSLEDMDTQ